MPEPSHYDARFYDHQAGGSAASAARIVPLLIDMLQPASVLDVGCGTGTWCQAFAEAGAAQSYGIDGPWVGSERFELGPQHFIPFDFEKAVPPYTPELPLAKFDLTISLEFLEHLPLRCADAVVVFLTQTADAVVAGAAPPGQGGRHHVNEQWPSFWRERFAAHGFCAYDALRPLIWDLPDVEPWYAQNTICYFRNAVPAAVKERTERAVAARLSRPSNVVHPEIFRRKTAALAKAKQGTLGKLLRRLRRPKA